MAVPAVHRGGCLFCRHWIPPGCRCGHPRNQPLRPHCLDAREPGTACGERGRLWEPRH